MNKETAAAILAAEEALGNNLVWLADALDLSIRQKDAQTLAKLDELNAAWVGLCKHTRQAREVLSAV